VKVLLDTNVLIAAFISHGSCHELLEYCFHDHQIVTSQELLDEFLDTLSGKLRFTKAEVREAKRLVWRMVTLVEPVPLGTNVCRDPDDDKVLAAAVGGGAACIVTGDKDLLVLEAYHRIPILSPDRFWSFEDI
jgi:putative PIN family toxin of toxin-antitoxin system